MQNPPSNQCSSSTASKETIPSQFDKFKTHLAAIEKASKECDYYIDMMGMQKGRPQSNFNKDEGHRLANYLPETSIDTLQVQLEQLGAYLKEREEYLKIDLAYLKKETGIDVKSPQSLFKNEGKTVTSQSVIATKKGQIEERKSDDKDAKKKIQELSQENKKIHAEIIEFKDLLEVMGGSTKEIGDVITLNNESDNLESLITMNKALRDQLLLASELLTKAGVDQKIKSFSSPEPKKSTTETKVPQRSKKELDQENQKIHKEIREFKELLEVMGESTKEIGEIVALNNESDNVESFNNKNKSLRDQLKLASDLLNKAGIGHKIKSIPCPEPENSVNKENSNPTAPQQIRTGEWARSKLEGMILQAPRKHEYKPLKPPVKNSKGEILLERPVLFTLGGDIFTKRSLRIDLAYYTDVPEPDKSLGDATKINEKKAEITPYADVWRSTVRNLISRYELVDIDRGNGRKRAIVKYRDRDDKDEARGVFPVFSRAYFKLWEVLDITGILDNYKDKPINIASLAEGPGGFIHCMVDWRKKQNGSEWNKDIYNAITLRNDGRFDHECIDWDGQVNYAYWKYAREKYSINLSYGASGKDATGDLLQKKNLEHFKNVDLKGKKCELVTADGGIHLEGDDSYSLQEVANIKLFFAEALYALSVQEIGGSFVMKIYDIYFEITVELILLLAFYYEKITVFKPLTSRPANSEKYIIAEGFKGISEDHLDRLDFTFFESLFGEEKNRDYLKNKNFVQKVFDFDVNEEKLKKWKKDLAKGNEMHMNSQIEAIEYGLGIASVNFASVDREFLTKKRQEQKEFCIAWCQRHGVPYIENFKV